MLGFIKHEIEKWEQKIIDQLRDTGTAKVPGLGTIYWTSGTETLRITPEPEVLEKLRFIKDPES